MTLLTTLIVLNIPVYLFIGWLAIDSKRGASESIGEATVGIIKAILLPRAVRALMEDEEDGAVGILTTAGFLVACGMIVYCEYYLITKYFLK